MAEKAKGTDVATTASADLPYSDPQAFNKIVQRAAKGDAKALAEVRAVTKAHPEVWNALGTDIAGVVRDAMIKLLTGEDAVMRDFVNHQLGKMKKGLIGEQPSPLERLLAERICACWLQVQYAEWIYATKPKAGMSLALGDYLQRQVDRAQARYLAAIRTLAQVRKLGLPDVQVNIGEKQVNVASGTQMNMPPSPVPSAVVEGEVK